MAKIIPDQSTVSYGLKAGWWNIFWNLQIKCLQVSLIRVQSHMGLRLVDEISSGLIKLNGYKYPWSEYSLVWARLVDEISSGLIKLNVYKYPWTWYSLVWARLVDEISSGCIKLNGHKYPWSEYSLVWARLVDNCNTIVMELYYNN